LLQEVQIEEPAAEYFPSLQRLHEPALLEDIFPAVQSVHREAPADAYFPAVQVEQVVWPSDSVILPAGQSSHES
jgi:hypothetical protein